MNTFMDKLRAREFTGSAITIEQTLSRQSAYTPYIVSYVSDGLKIYAAMNVPDGNGPFPVIILNHGYFNASSFSTGDGTKTMADILARNGYLTLASDYRGHGKSEDDGQGSRGHRPEYAIDVLNLIASVKNLDKVSPDRIGMWGHSMGGEVGLRVAEVTNELKAIVLWAPTTTRSSDNAFGRRNQPVSSSNPVSDNSSPMNYLQYISTPISLHQGLVDTEVKPEFTKKLNEALKNEGKSIEYFEYPDQDHNFRNLGWDEISRRTLTFFDKYLKDANN
ncbi:MAG: Peptidase [Candidatus Beckwithbacteria bacterium GW2011_GWB1_47_15]|uniref:Peptidase n=1 Tax=Candidatus Beckwithbacteria bacterium GW2011_GWB1_47_15 TaxID=1618371 RepID=A0A0G1US54_9BACT|nr:MAG: Peptidase [Candidatus Beckwithbacteria bacterium GW2011_GWB1_47_15]KKU71325.1 MAG: Peptidase [Candidatus Beckwithbacteria bacterium GW2011_GWA2_47_25]